MKLNNSTAEVFIPDGKPQKDAFRRITHLGIGAHQDDLEFMAFHGILTCFARDDKWFGGVTCTNGAGSSRTGSTSDAPTVYSDTTSWINRSRAGALAARASRRRSCSRNTSTPRSRIFATNRSCSSWARSTHSTSSNSSSSWFDGVSRWRLRSGRCTITLRSVPTSECTPKPV